MLINHMGLKVREVDSDVLIAVAVTSLTVRMEFHMFLQLTVHMRVQRWKHFIADADCIDVASEDDAMTIDQAVACLAGYGVASCEAEQLHEAFFLAASCSWHPHTTV